MTLAAALLAGCGGGDGNISIGSGQRPDPVVVDIRIAYISRPVPLEAQASLMADARRLLGFSPGAELWVRERAAPAAAARNVTAAFTQGLYDIRDLEASADGERLLFAMRGPFIEGAAEEDQPTWNIWEYELESDELRRIIGSEVTAEAGHDLAPHYLPDGRILFTSTRQRQNGAVLVDEGKPQFPGLDEDRREPAFVLHSMNADGSDIRQLSFNQSHDLDPMVLSTGEVVFTRWDNAGRINRMSLYQMNPDGTGLQLLYGANSHATGTAGATVQFLQPRELPDGRLLVLLRPQLSPLFGGNLVAIDVAHHVDNDQPLAFAAGAYTGPAQTVLTVNDVSTDGSISMRGSYAGAWPLHDGTNRLLVSWSQCRVLEDGRPQPCTERRLAQPGLRAAAPIYGLWVYDPRDETQQPVVVPEEGLMYTDVVALEARRPPLVIPDKASIGEVDATMALEGTGVISIRSVYDIDGSATRNIAATADPALHEADDRPARFLRIEKAVSIPDREVRNFRSAAYGATSSQGMREILGYKVIEPDGSVMVKLPANVPIALSVVDRHGRRITSRHRSWLQLRPGEQRSCNGCHSRSSGLSHGRDGLFESAWTGAPLDGQPFPNTSPALWPDAGETMAEVHVRHSCMSDDCRALLPAMDPVFEDPWTDPAVREPDEAFALAYADLETPAPVDAGCLDAWAPACRSVINYESHIHPLWGLSRPLLDADDNVIADHRCSSCHNAVGEDGLVQLPAAQLDLGDGPSGSRPAYFKSYADLFYTHNKQELVGGTLQDVLQQVGVEPETEEPIFEPVMVSPPMSTSGALQSARFFGRFLDGGDHAGWLSPAELRLVAEWVDLGAQYYNNPFDAPLN